LNSGSAQTISGVKTFSAAPKISATLANSLNDATMVSSAWVKEITNTLAKLDASNLTNANVESWNDRLGTKQKIFDYTVPSATTQVNITGLDLIGDGNIYEIYFCGIYNMEDYLYLRTNNRADARYYTRYNTFMDNPKSAYLSAQTSMVAGCFPTIAKITLQQFENYIQLFSTGQGIVSGQYATYLTMGRCVDDENVESIQLFTLNGQPIRAGTRIVIYKLNK
jgi:hypothetical protein